MSKDKHTQTKTLLIMAGGTGGHIFPALAVARAVQAAGMQVAWLGTAKRMEAEIVPKAGIPFFPIDVQAIRGQGWRRRLLAPLTICIAIVQALRVMRQIKPDVVLGMGGFASGPGGIAAKCLNIPLVIHEQNAVPSKTNQILSYFANTVCESFPGSFKKKRNVHLTGNPVREDLLSIATEQPRVAEDRPRRLLVLGGSQGAKTLNEIVPQALQRIPEAKRPEVWHQCGAEKLEATEARYQQAHLLATVQPFVENMRDAYTWADLAICRAGALTIAELAAVGLGSILVPYPHAVDDHQTHNSEYLVAAHAARRLAESSLSAPVLADLLNELLGSHETLNAMAANARGQAQLTATAQVAAQCMEWCGVHAKPVGD